MNSESSPQISSDSKPAPAGARGLSAVPAWGFPAAAMAIVLVLLVIAAFSPCLSNDFVTWDDDQNFLKNPHYRGLGWSQLRWAWTSFRIGVYQPLAWMLLEAQYALFGLRPREYHLCSLLLYALDAVVLFALTVALLVRCRPGLPREAPRSLVLGSGLAVALFAVHPLRTEVVAWASAQPYLPCAFFSMLTVLAYLRAFPEGAAPRRGWLLGAFLLFVAALLSKAVAVSLPAVLLILDVYPLRRLGGGPGRWFGASARRAWWEKVPFVALSVLFMNLAVVGRQKVRHLVSVEDWGLSSRVAQACYGVWFYPIKTVLPWDITAFYPVPERMGLLEVRPLLSLLATLAVTVALFLLRRRSPAPLAAWLSYLVILAPNSGLLRVSNQVAADRYSYIAMMGLVVLLAAGLCRCWRAGARARPVASGLMVAASFVVLTGLIALSRAQCRTWRTTDVLLSHALSHGAGHSFKMHELVGGLLFQQGRLEEARSHFAEFVRLQPRDADARTSLGSVLLEQGRLERAAVQIAEAIRLDPEHADALNMRAVLLLRQGRLGEALAQCAAVLRIRPGHADVRNTLGLVLLEQGRREEAKAQFAEAIRLAPNSADPHNNLGAVLYAQGRLEEAAAQFAEALRLRPNHTEARNNLGMILRQLGRPEEAMAQFAEAVRLDPNQAQARNSLGAALFEQGRLEEAKAQFAEAVRLDPEHADAHRNLALVQRKQRERDTPPPRQDK